MHPRLFVLTLVERVTWYVRGGRFPKLVELHGPNTTVIKMKTQTFAWKAIIEHFIKNSSNQKKQLFWWRFDSCSPSITHRNLRVGLEVFTLFLCVCDWFLSFLLSGFCFCFGALVTLGKEVFLFAINPTMWNLTGIYQFAATTSLENP